MNDIGLKIKAYRTAMKLTQAELAVRLGVTGAAVSAYENGSRLPSYDVLRKAARIMGISVDELIGKSPAGSVMVDVSGLTAEQRIIIQQTIDIFRAYNETQKQDASEP